MNDQDSSTVFLPGVGSICGVTAWLGVAQQPNSVIELLSWRLRREKERKFERAVLFSFVDASSGLSVAEFSKPPHSTRQRYRKS